MQSELKRKLWAIMAVNLGLVLMVGVLGVVAISRDIGTLRFFITQDMAFQDMGHEVMINLLQQRRYEKDFFLNIGQSDRQKEYLENYRGMAAAFDRQINQMEELARPDPHLSAQVKEKIFDLARLHRDYIKGFQSVVDRVESDPGLTPQAANGFMETHKRSFPDLEKDVRVIVDAANQMQERVARQSIDDGERARTLILAVFVGAVAVAGMLGAWLARSVYLAFLRVRLQNLSDSP